MKIVKELKTNVKDVTEKGIVTIQITQFDKKDSDNDRLMKGALTKTWKEGTQRHLVDHKMGVSTLVGAPINKDAETGIIESKLNLNKQVARDLLEDYKFFQEAGQSLQHSHGFIGINGKVEKNEFGGRDFHEVRQFEYSTVVFGAVEETPLHGIKNLDNTTIEETIELLEKKLKFCNYSDEKGNAILKQIEFLKTLIKEPFTDTLINNEEPSKDTQMKQFYDNLLTKK